jgi:hypothetical protein
LPILQGVQIVTRQRNFIAKGGGKGHCPVRAAKGALGLFYSNVTKIGCEQRLVLGIQQAQIQFVFTRGNVLWHRWRQAINEELGRVPILERVCAMHGLGVDEDEAGAVGAQQLQTSRQARLAFSGLPPQRQIEWFTCGDLDRAALIA